MFFFFIIFFHPHLLSHQNFNHSVVNYNNRTTLIQFLYIEKEVTVGNLI